MCELAGDFLKSHQLRHFSHRQTLWTQLEDFARTVHASLDPREAAYTIANEGRRLIECDRLSVAIRKGKKCVVEAISGQDLFDKRSNIVRMLNHLATAVVATGEAVWYTGDTRDMAPQVEEAVQEYVDEAHSKLVAVLPLARSAPLDEEDDPTKRDEADGPIGALIIEQIEDSRVSGALVQRGEVVSRHSSTALANALEHQNLFLMPVWRALGKTRWVVQSRTLPKTLSIVGAVLLVLLVLIVWPARFTLESKGSLEPVVRQDVFAGIDGVVKELDCSHNDIVPKGKTLVQLRNTDLEVALTDVEGQRMANEEQLINKQRWLSEEKKLNDEQKYQLAGDLAELLQKKQTLDAQWQLYKAKEKELDIKSPLNGLVVTWDLQNRLPIGRPVQRGQVLLRVADPEGPWQLELRMPEQRMGHIVKYQKKMFDAAREKLRELIEQDVRAKLGDAASNEDVQQQVDAELAKILDVQLHDRLLAEYRQRMDQSLQALLGNIADETIRTKLQAVLQEKSYDAAREKLKAVLPEIETADAALYAELQKVPMDEPPDDRLEVSYILATEPGKTRYGKVTEIHRSAEIRGDEGNTVLIKVAIDKSDVPDPRPGATVTAQVYCGRRSLGYVLLHDVVAFIQSRILFRYF
jgi:multidrug efflux pump subunit AcrA (membrane-fusion protein)